MKFSIPAMVGGVLLVTTGISCAMASQNLSSDLKNALMHSWAEVNRARIIAPRDVPAFFPRIISAYLDLYRTLCNTITRASFVPSEISSMASVLHELCISHRALCEEYRFPIAQGAHFLLVAIINLWDTATKYAADNEKPKT